MAIRSPLAALFVIGCLWLAGCRAAPSIQEAPPLTPSQPTPPAAQLASVTLQRIAGNFQRPTYLTHAFDDRLFIVEQAGRVSIIAGGQRLAEPFLDISRQVESGGNEQGLLSLAFHPTDHDRFFVNYTDLQGDTRISEFLVTAENRDRADAGSERTLLTVAQPYGNHNGGQIKFGPDGYLYIGMGDGGASGDPHGYGQNRDTLLGALLRLDVDQAQPYAIPPDNPFLNDPASRPEIWAYGLRNPWRFSFDRLTGDLYIADVGQNAWEELNFVTASSGGENYGWNRLEGTHCFNPRLCRADGTLLPILEYDHNDGCSITGGYVYRGTQFPSLSGHYFFSDYCGGVIWNLRHNDADWQKNPLLETNLNISSFGEDAAGDLYVLDHAGGDVYQLQP